jgi:hypothetical protein
MGATVRVRSGDQSDNSIEAEVIALRDGAAAGGAGGPATP